MQDTNITIGDQHFGKQSNNLFVFGYTERFFREQIYARCLEENEKKNPFSVTLMGDMFHNESLISGFISSRIIKMIYEISALEYCMEIYVLVGNHDTWTKQSNSDNSANILLYRPKIKVIHNHLTTTTPSGKKIFLISHKANENEFIDCVMSDSSDIIYMHQEIEGFLYKGENSFSKITKGLLSKYSLVVNGHLHNPLKLGNILLTGSIEQNNFGERNNITGFWIIDHSMEENPYIIPNTISPVYKHFNFYEISQKSNEELNRSFNNSYIKIFCQTEEDYYNCQDKIKDLDTYISIKPIKLFSKNEKDGEIHVEEEMEIIRHTVKEKAISLIKENSNKEINGVKLTKKISEEVLKKIDDYHKFENK